ncbi:MAG: glucan 1,4-alpha-glucosidase [Hyphomicrobiales bacterium]|nr:glucan 1,4-alpha-glucosidase [Hyphomicrobiales bacterium]
MTNIQDRAPGAPGISARWTSSAKSGVGTALSPACEVWFTVSHGILNEVYYPRVDMACTRDLGLIVTGANGMFSEEKRDTEHWIEPLEDGVPAYRLVNTARNGSYRIEKRIVVDPVRPALLQETTFTPQAGTLQDYRVYALLAPHLVNAGMHNTGWIGDYKGTRMLFASGSDGMSLALASSAPWQACSAGYVGVSDGWQQLKHGGRLEPEYRRAENGNVALTGEIGFSTENDGKTLLVLGFGPSPEEAGYNALASLQAGFEASAEPYVKSWRGWQGGLLALDRKGDRKGEDGPDSYRVSTAVLAAHRPLGFPGPAVASLSIPWGFSKGDEDLGGYHLVWPRDLVETAGGFLAAGAADDALAILSYLRTIQEADGHWPQNAWLDGTAYWGGIQMDETALPILLVDALYREGHLTQEAIEGFAEMILNAATFILRNGPVTGQDRWEEDAGYTPFTLAAEIAGLLAAADLLERCGRAEAAPFARETADCWNEQIERWLYATGTQTCSDFGVDGYYVRVSAPDTADAASPKDGFVPIKNRPPADTQRAEWQIVSPDALALVRFGLRAADDPRMVDTVKIIDATLRRDLPQGPLWRRYNEDGYGEHEDGSPFDGTGVGRSWPLLAGERAHYELAAGRKDTAQKLLATMEASSGPGGLMPEQIWDGPDMPGRELFHGKPAGSAMPLVWAHAEHIKLLRSLRDGAVFDMPPHARKRYIDKKTASPYRSWRFNNKIRSMPAGRKLRIEALAPARIHWSLDGWTTVNDTETTANIFGIHVADLPVDMVKAGAAIDFTFFWSEAGHWENLDFSVRIEPAS